MTEEKKKPTFRELGIRWRHAYDRPWTLAYLIRAREHASIILAQIELGGEKRVAITNGHFMAEMNYLSRCVSRLDKQILKVYADGVFPTSFGASVAEDAWERNITGMKQYFTEFSEKAIPIEDTQVLVNIDRPKTDWPIDANPVAILRYRLGSSTGLDIPRYVVVDPSYHYLLRRYAKSFKYNADYSSIFYYENEVQGYPSAMLATLTPSLAEEVQKHLDFMSMFLPEEEKEGK